MLNLYTSSLNTSHNSASLCEVKVSGIIMCSFPHPYTWLPKWTKAKSFPKLMQPVRELHELGCGWSDMPPQLEETDSR